MRNVMVAQGNIFDFSLFDILFLVLWSLDVWIDNWFMWEMLGSSRVLTVGRG